MSSSVGSSSQSRRMKFGRYDLAAFGSFFAYAAGSIVVPVALVSLARDLGFSLEKGGMSAGGALHFGRTVTMVLTLSLCGFAAGRFGKRKTLGFSVALMALGLALCSAAPYYGILFLAMLIAGMGEGVIEGLATPFVQDLHPEEPGRYINFAHSFWSVGVLVMVLASGALMSLGVSWRYMVAGASVLAAIATVSILAPEAKGHEYPESAESMHWTQVYAHARKILATPRFWVFFAAMFVAGGGEFSLTFWCASYVQLNFVDTAWAGGLGTAFFAAGMVAGRSGWGYLIDQQHLKHLILWSAICGTALTLFLPMLTGLWWLFALLFLSGIATAPFWPSIQSYSTDRLPHLDTTMMFILLSCAGIPGCGTLAWLMGYLGNTVGLRQAFYLVPLCYIILAALIIYDWRRPTVISKKQPEAGL